MAIPWYLAMSEEEMASAIKIPAHRAWLDCSFSPEGPGLSGLPDTLPEGMLLILTDRMSPEGHDPALIAEQLRSLLPASGCPGVLLDFEGSSQAHLAMAESLSASLPCPVAVSEPCCQATDGPVFLPPCPHHIPLKAHLARHPGRELWLDLAMNASSVRVTARGPHISSASFPKNPKTVHRDSCLHCHYMVTVSEDAAQFLLWRTKEDLHSLAREAEELGVSAVLGLYQELH